MFDHRQDQALTVISLSDEVPRPPEQREEARNLSILKAAVLRTALGEELCLVRNISSAGLMAHIFSDLAVRDPIRIEFHSGATVRGRVVWRQPELMGVRFSQRIDVATILSEQGAPSGYVARAPRIAVSAPARLRSGADCQSAALCNISQGGARILLNEPRLVGEAVVLSLPGLDHLAGTVKWRADSYAGIGFRDLIAFEDVGRWIVDHHSVDHRATAV